eukprot:CAMPEP_0114546544 /NCGR_PEP_ID=MMETSP0114-20121206/3989_1 /TAXON_ID=31324 /ORGANISM="Goniomonas sp, Strain m" /LENGTH=167 /DNA_ID=CAMNT_0001731043 /DNA_START=114 /DNA_END=618 /DNA_ORIENTATION=-
MDRKEQLGVPEQLVEERGSGFRKEEAGQHTQREDIQQLVGKVLEERPSTWTVGGPSHRGSYGLASNHDCTPLESPVDQGPTHKNQNSKEDQAERNVKKTTVSLIRDRETNSHSDDDKTTNEQPKMVVTVAVHNCPIVKERATGTLLVVPVLLPHMLLELVFPLMFAT